MTTTFDPNMTAEEHSARLQNQLMYAKMTQGWNVVKVVVPEGFKGAIAKDENGELVLEIVRYNQPFKLKVIENSVQQMGGVNDTFLVKKGP